VCNECEKRENAAVQRIARSLGFAIEVETHNDGTMTVRNLAKASSGQRTLGGATLQKR